ncbi:FxLD family lanthipeptide [Gandjariella thermophila]|nr:FxLD family lanthipeptide [Gandjariella thermophila]
MPATLTTEALSKTAAAVPTSAVEDPFALDIQIITDVPAGHPLAACKGGTDDGCDPTCASACISDGV